MTFSYDRAWNDAQALWRAHGEFVAILAGLFIMVPEFVRNLFLPIPPIRDFGPESLALMRAYLLDNGWSLVLLNLVVLFGSAAILCLMLDARRPTVGEAIKVAFVMVPSIFVLNILSQFAVFGGLLLFVVPGIYVMGRLALASAAQMSERQMNPLRAIRQSLDLTRGRGWSIAGLLLIVFVVTWIATGAIATVIGILLSVIIPKGSLAAVAGFLSAILSAVTYLAFLLLSAAAYRQLASTPDGARR